LALFQDFVNRYLWSSKKDVGPNYNPLNGSSQWANLVGFNDNFSEEAVSERRALGLATVWSCINVRARTVASLDIDIIMEEDDRKIELDDHPAYYPLAHQPNNYMSSANMFLTSMIHSDAWGNSIIAISRDSRGKPYAFDIVPPNEWSVKVADGQAWYKLGGELYSADDVLHFRWFSIDGLTGISPIRQNAMLMGKAFRENRYSTMALGKKPPGILSYEGVLTPVQQAQNQASWKTDLAAGDTPILSGRWKFDPILMSAEDAAYIETAKLTDQQIYGIYQMPPAFVQNYDRMTWTNAEQADLVYAKHTITPIVRVIEQECNMKLFTRKEKKNTYVKMNMNGLLRGDSKARAEFYTAMRNIGGMNGNDIRYAEDLDSYEGGDIFTVQGASVPIDQLREFYASKVAPTASPNTTPAAGTNGSTNGKLNGKYHVN